MADILLTHGYFLDEDEKERQIMKPYSPLGILYLSAYLKREGFSVDLFDSTLRTREELYLRLAAERGGVLGLYTNLITRSSILAIIKRAKNLGWTVIVGGPESANYPEKYLEFGADAVVIGEGETALSNLLTALRDRGANRLEGVQGVCYRDEEGRFVRNPSGPQITNLDDIPWPDRQAVDIGAYVDLWRTHHGSGSVNLITARGCPYKCTWCSHAVYGYSHRRRGHFDCADELEAIRDTYRPDQVWYADDVFTIHHRWLYDYSRELDRRGLRLPFETISRADRMMDEEVLATLARMGCYRIWIGSESGSQRILDSMRRGVTTEQVRWATHAAKRHGIQVGMFLMWGYDGETAEDIEATVEHVKRANPDVFFTTVAYPIKNTPYFDRVADTVSLQKSWEESTDRDFEIRGRKSREYYRQADIWLRNAVEASRQGEDSDTGRRYGEIAGHAKQAIYASAAGAEA